MKKTLSVCLALLMLLSCFAMPTTAFAAAPKKPTVSSVSAGAAAFTVKWKKVSGVTGYQVQYSTSSKFSSKTSKTATAKKDKTTAKTVSGLKSKTKYYVRVRTYKTRGKKKKYSSWSSAKSVTTKVAKVNFKSVSAERLGFTVKWSKAPSVSGYRVQYSTSSKFNKKVTKALKITNGNATSATITGLKGGKKYYVRVQAYVNQGKKSYSGAYSAAKTVTTAKDPFKKGKYAGVQLNTTADAVRYYVKAYNATKKETAKYQNKETDEILTYYKLLGVKTLGADNVYINGSRNKFMDSYLDSMISDTKVGTGLPPCTAVDKSEDTDLNGKSLVTSRLRDTDVETLSIKDNKNGTVTPTIKPKSVQMSSPGVDAQGRFFSTLGPMYDTFDQMLKQNGGKWTTGNAKKNLHMNYTGGTGTITINTSSGKITKATYNMKVNVDVQHVTISGMKNQRVQLRVIVKDTFPMSQELFDSSNLERL